MADNCGQALTRFASYRPRQDAEPNCPYCWIVEGDALRLQVGPRPNSYRCSKSLVEYPKVVTSIASKEAEGPSFEAFPDVMSGQDLRDLVTS